MIRTLIIGGLLTLSSTPIWAQQEARPKSVKQENTPTTMFENKMDSASYAFGLSMGRDLKKRGLKHLNSKLVAQAIRDVFEEKPSLLTEDKEYEVIREVLMAAAEDLKKEQSAAGDAFLANNKTKKGIHSTASGLQYEIVRDAVGPKPKATDSVTVNYKGTLLDGKVFDNSYDRGEPITFQLNQVIPGWQEGLQLMSVGSHYRFYVPYQLAYGERGAGNDIPPYSVLIFDVELLKIGG